MLGFSSPRAPRRFNEWIHEGGASAPPSTRGCWPPGGSPARAARAEPARLREEAGEPTLWGRAHRHLRDLPQTPTWEGTQARVPSFTARPLTDAQAITREQQSRTLTRRLLSVLKIFHKDYAWFSPSEKSLDKFCKITKVTCARDPNHRPSREVSRNTSLLPPTTGALPRRMPLPTA